jgi:hypothetical protein
MLTFRSVARRLQWWWFGVPRQREVGAIVQVMGPPPGATKQQVSDVAGRNSSITLYCAPRRNHRGMSNVTEACHSEATV